MSARIGPSLFQHEACLMAGAWLIDGCKVVRQPSGRQWAIYGPCDEYGMAKSLAGARRMIRRGLCDNCTEAHAEKGCPA